MNLKVIKYHREHQYCGCWGCLRRRHFLSTFRFSFSLSARNGTQPLVYTFTMVLHTLADTVAIRHGSAFSLCFPESKEECHCQITISALHGKSTRGSRGQNPLVIPYYRILRFGPLFWAILGCLFVFLGLLLLIFGQFHCYLDFCDLNMASRRPSDGSKKLQDVVWTGLKVIKKLMGKSDCVC